MELVALKPQLKQQSLDVEKLMDKLQTDQDEADKVGINWWSGLSTCRTLYYLPFFISTFIHSIISFAGAKSSVSGRGSGQSKSR